MFKKVSIIIPTYKERENIILLLGVLEAQSQINKDYSYEVVVVDDNSLDGTAEEVSKKFKPPFLKLIVRKGERGLGTAIGVGMASASGEVVVGMDADFNHDPGILPELIKKLEHCDLVVASRFIKGGGMDNKLRYASTKLFNFVLRIIFAFPTTDNASGYYAIRKKDLKRLNPKDIYYGYGDYHLRLVYKAKVAGYKICETPVYYKERPYGESKSKLFKMAMDYTKEAIRLRFYEKQNHSTPKG